MGEAQHGHTVGRTCLLGAAGPSLRRVPALLSDASLVAGEICGETHWRFTDSLENTARCIEIQ